MYFDSYRTILEHCEQYLNTPYEFGYWGGIIENPPVKWGAVANPAISEITKDEFRRATKGCIFPVHAMGYNWLQSNVESAKNIAKRLRDLITGYQERGFECAKVIVVTHSMGGLVGRALVHPSMGNAKEEILGMVHGVMPAMGAPAAYRRMRCGFEESGAGLNPGPKILGNYGAEVTAVLGNAPGGLQLLPSCGYGNGWLRIRHRGRVIEQFPKNGDPYSEIYTLRGAWYGLLREEWLNPADQASSSFELTCERLAHAKQFHQDIADTYHEQSYAHYGADTKRASWETVSWDIETKDLESDWRDQNIVQDTQKGELRLGRADSPRGFSVVLGASEGPGDQTVPIRSADHQFFSGRFKAIFRQTGYEHQSSFSDIRAVNSTMFSIIKIAATMRWATDDCKN